MVIGGDGGGDGCKMVLLEVVNMMKDIEVTGVSGGKSRVIINGRVLHAETHIQSCYSCTSNALPFSSKPVKNLYEYMYMKMNI